MAMIISWAIGHPLVNQKNNTKKAIETILPPIQWKWYDLAFTCSNGGKNGQIDHLIPEQIDHRFRFKMTT